jgi:creatinine amidohydrolase
MTRSRRIVRTTLPALFLALLPLLSWAQPGSVYIEDLTWPEVREAIAHGKTTAIFYAGSTEQNGPHMALGKHNVIARYVAGRIAEELGNALVYPVLPFAPTGDPAKKTGHMRFPGSVSLTEATYGAVAREVAQSALAAGFSNVVLMGEHGDGQRALERAAQQLERVWSAKGKHVYYIGDAYYVALRRVNAYLSAHGLPASRHAGIHDTSELMYLDPDERWLRRDKLAPGDARSGVEGDPRKSSAALGKRFLDIQVASAVEQIRRLVK